MPASECECAWTILQRRHSNGGAVHKAVGELGDKDDTGSTGRVTVLVRSLAATRAFQPGAGCCSRRLARTVARCKGSWHGRQFESPVAGPCIALRKWIGNQPKHLFKINSSF